MLESMEALIREHGMLPRGCTVLCAVSGGADSVCLLDLVRRLGDVTVLCAHFDHGIRGAESARDAAFVEALCKDWGVPFFPGRGDVPAYAAANGLSIETAAREMRYAFLERTAKEQGADVIATAHNLNDNAETILFRMARGTGLRGLTGIPARRGEIVRPLLQTPRRDIEEYLTAHGIPHVEDSTNAETDAARNRIRLDVLPRLESIHPGAAAGIARMSRRITPFGAMFCTAVAASMIACNQTLSILLTHQLCADTEPDGPSCAIDLENSVVVLAPLVPWSIAGAVPLASAGAPEQSLLAACYLYLIPLCSLVWKLLRRRRVTA